MLLDGPPPASRTINRDDFNRGIDLGWAQISYCMSEMSALCHSNGCEINSGRAYAVSPISGCTDALQAPLTSKASQRNQVLLTRNTVVSPLRICPMAVGVLDDKGAINLQRSSGAVYDWVLVNL